jgi:membrane protein DedA with SNARE-associated domain
MLSFVNSFISTLLVLSGKFGYSGVVLLMAVESSFIPFPSEVIIPSAAFLAAQGKFNIYLVVIAGIIGSLIGALVNYFLALTLGRSVIYALARSRVARVLLINEKKVKKAEDYFLRYGNWATFTGRLIPAVRQLISLPAGFARMNLGNFLFYTFLGSGLWTGILAVLGYIFGAKKELLHHYYQQISFILIGLVVGGGIIYWLFKNYFHRRH